MNRIPIKPLSVNEAWKGRRFKTDAYKRYERDVIMILPSISIPKEKLSVSLRFGLSNKRADIDNPVKCFVDCLQKKYGFDDKDIYRMTLEKVDVKKGEEFIEFSIASFTEEEDIKAHYAKLGNDLQKTLN